ncbi:MAG TPA: TrkH family potassium uptake protein [Proteobacteria bacterium]|nr:TrkH family potassium uptake protein [Pseudomonadota bacterium]
MRVGTVFQILGWLLLFLSLSLILPIPFSLFYKDGLMMYFIMSSALTALAGGFLVLVFVPDGELGYKDGFAVVSLGWLAAALFSALPFYLSGAISSFLDCYFEAMSGFTTTGSTILARVEPLGPSLLLWRAMTQWLGGMGIIVLSLAILPILGVGGMQLFRAEVPGPTKDRLAPRIQDTARILWGVYTLLTGIETVLLMWGGLSFYDALCHSFTTMATGGFSTYTASVGYFNSPWVEGVITFFMLMAGINFALHYQGLKGRLSAYWKSEEFRFYIGVTIIATILVTIFNIGYGLFGSLGTSFRYSIFQVSSILTTTGYGTADFDKWPYICQLLLVVLMFFGGCAGSTGGGIKHVRILLLWRYLRIQMVQLVHPRAVKVVKLGGQKVPAEVMQAILGFFFLYLVVFIVASLLVSSQGLDIVTSISAVAATLNNIGPGLGLVGPVQHFGHLPALSKFILIICMLAGRLELYTVAVLLTPAYWKTTRKPVFRWQRDRSQGDGKSR